MKKGKVLIAAPVHPVLTEGLISLGYELIHEENITRQMAASFIADCEGLIISTRLQMDREMVDKAPSLKWIGRMGSGMEVIDVPYADSKGIICFSSPEGNCNAVAEHTLGLLLALTKKIVSSNIEVKDGLWIRDANRGVELEGKTIGIIGFGHAGKAFAGKLAGFDMKILVYDKYKKDAAPGNITHCDSLEAIFQKADIISFHVPLQEDTIYYFNNEFLSNMKKPFILLNTSRGIVVETGILIGGLETGKIVGAGLDVLEGEPLERMQKTMRSMMDELVKLPQVIVTPHIAGYSFEALYKMSKVLLEKIVTYR